MMREKYIDLMEKVLSAYSTEHIIRYFDEVKANGLTEHGFPRLTSNIGILIAHGRRNDLLKLFIEMMDFCCEQIPLVKAANDFSVREIICCLEETEKSGLFEAKKLKRWKELISTIVPENCYNVFASSTEALVKNWALFTGVSEFYRKELCPYDNGEFIDTQIGSQLKWLDSNGMYMDNEGDIHHPFVYDIVPRGLFSLLLFRGYNGKYRDILSETLKKSALLTLKMQSPNGEIPFGGRSNQFLHNEAWYATIYEFEANRYIKLGDLETAKKFKSGIARAISVIESWLKNDPITHIKNRFDTATSYGCENYAYFDKYMITAASFLYSAYSMCNESIEAEYLPDTDNCAFMTTEHFHKLFLKCFGYGIEIDTNADPHYDASGIGRVHRAGAPSTICMSSPCPSHPIYNIGEAEHKSLSICPAVKTNDEWHNGADVPHKVKYYRENKASTSAKMTCTLADKTVSWTCSVRKNGVTVKAYSDEVTAITLPAFCFDGKNETVIRVTDSRLEIVYDGYICRYTAIDGKIEDMNAISKNRNGHYRTFAVIGDKKASVRISIIEQRG